MDIFHFILNLERSLYKKGKLCRIFSKLLYRFLRAYYCCDIPPSVKCDKVYFCHTGFGTLLNEKTVIGEDSKIQHGVTIGEINGEVPVIGKGCFVGAKATILGGIVIGDDCKIGAGSLVIDDIPSGCTAVGVPAHIIRKNNE